MKAKFSGRCKCGTEFRKGDEIDYSRTARKVIACPNCSKAKPDTWEPDRFDMQYEDNCRDMCGL